MARLINFEGRQISVPDDATDDEIASILESGSGAPAPAAPPAPAGPPPIDPQRMERSAAAPGPRIAPEDAWWQTDTNPSIAATQMTGPVEVTPADGRQLMLGTQSVGRGAANVAGFLPDLAALGLNAGLAGADRLAEQFGGNVDYRFSMPRENLKEGATALAESAGVPLQTPENFREKAIGKTVEMGTEGLVGAGGILRAGGKRLIEMTRPGATPRLFDSILRPYGQNPTKTAIGDAVAGGASGGALAASQEYVPDSVRNAGRGTAGAILDLLAMLTGGVGGGTLSELVTGTPLAVRNAAKGASAAKDIPFDPETGLPVTNRVADKAAEFVQGQAIDPQAAVAEIQRQVDAYRTEGLPLPTTGLISGDTGLEMLERGERVKNSTGTIVNSPDADPAVKAQYSFGERDTNLRDAARDQVNGLRPEGADASAFPRRAEEIATARTETAQRQADQAQGQARGIEMAQRGPAEDLNAFQGQGNAASRNIDQTVRETRDAELQQSRQLYNDPALTGAQVSDQPLRDVADELQALNTQRAPLDPVVGKYVDRFRTRLDEEGNPLPNNEPFTMREVNANIAEVEKDIQDNLANGAVVSQLRRVKQTLTGYAETLADSGEGAAAEAAAAARRNYAERVAPNFRQGAGGQFDANLKRDPTGYNTRPTDTADIFLTRPEDAQDLMRIGALRGNEQQAAENARTWLFDQLARTGVAKDGAIDAEKLTRWRNINDELLGSVPGLREEVNGMVRQARRGEALSLDAADALRRAQGTVRDVGEALRTSAVGQVAGKSPEKAVASVFASGNPEASMAELARTIGRNPEARDGLKAAVADYFAGKVSGVAPQNVSDGTQNINFAQLVKEFNKNERALAQVFSPDEMNALRRAQKLLEPLAQRQGQATTGSVTAENNEMTWRTLEAGLKLWYGALKGGGVLRSLRLASSTVWNGATEREAQRLVSRMMFDPDLAAHLLTRKTADVASPAWNSKLQTILRRTEAAKGIYEDDPQGSGQPPQPQAAARP